MECGSRQKNSFKSLQPGDTGEKSSVFSFVRISRALKFLTGLSRSPVDKIGEHRHTLIMRSRTQSVQFYYYYARHGCSVDLCAMKQ
jgi:hypothetical protein